MWLLAAFPWVCRVVLGGLEGLSRAGRATPCLTWSERRCCSGLCLPCCVPPASAVLVPSLGSHAGSVVLPLAAAAMGTGGPVVGDWPGVTHGLCGVEPRSCLGAALSSSRRAPSS